MTSINVLSKSIIPDIENINNLIYVMVVDGHHRLLAAKRLGLTEVPVEMAELSKLQTEIPVQGGKWNTN
ncbi:MAG: ParB N-terminal domain-containing protein [Lachnospiraceae bacterium]|nr:ParB N-terminal domain-containing protein [Lachnospiraceae bacterium]